MPASEIILHCGSKAHFIPLRKLLSNLIMHAEICTWFSSQCQAEHGDDVLRDFSDGLRFMSHPVISGHEKNVIGMILGNRL